jgi:hypothetical protein
MSAEQVLEWVSGSDPVWSVIWLHGLGADNTDFQDLPRLLQLPPNEAVRFLLPNAPKRPITLNGGVVMRGWYDIEGLDMARRVDVVPTSHHDSPVKRDGPFRCIGQQEPHRFVRGQLQQPRQILKIGIVSTKPM